MPDYDDDDAAVPSELEPLLHPSATTTVPTAAAFTAIAFDARKVKPSHAAPGQAGGERCHLG